MSTCIKTEAKDYNNAEVGSFRLKTHSVVREYSFIIGELYQMYKDDQIHVLFNIAVSTMPPVQTTTEEVTSEYPTTTGKGTILF